MFLIEYTTKNLSIIIIKYGGSMGINDEIFNEISEAREYERNAQNLIIQIISTAATVLGVIFAGYVYK